LMSCAALSKLRYNVRMRRWSCIAAVSLVVMAMPLWAQRHGGGGGAHFSSSGASAGHSSVARSSMGGSSVGRFYSARSFSARSSFARSSGAFRGGSVGRSSGVRIRTGNTYSRGFYGRRGYYPYTGYYPYGYGWYADPLYDTDDQDAYSGEYNPAPGPYTDESGTERDLDQLNGRGDRLQQDVGRAIGRSQIPNPQRRWCSVISMSRKCIITPSRVECSGCLTIRPRKRFRSPSSIFLPPSRPMTIVAWIFRCRGRRSRS